MLKGENLINLVERFGESEALLALVNAITGPGEAFTVGVEKLSGSAFAVAAAAAMQRAGGVHVFVCDDRDSAAYLANDLYNLGVEAMFFPLAYKRSIRFGQQDASGIVQRTAVLNAIRTFNSQLSTFNFLAVCTWPEALAEKVVSRDEIIEKTLTLRVGETVSMSTVEDILMDWGFARVDFVFEPGQYSIRGGIFDIFSYSAPRPYRVDFFGDEIDTIRIFEISSQLSAEKVDRMEVLPNLKSERRSVSSFASFVGDAVWWVNDLGFTLGKLDALRKKVLSELDEPKEIGDMVTSAKEFMVDTAGAGMVVRTGSDRRPAEKTIEFATAPQPEFNKQFELLADNIVYFCN